MVASRGRGELALPACFNSSIVFHGFLAILLCPLALLGTSFAAAFAKVSHLPFGIQAIMNIAVLLNVHCVPMERTLLPLFSIFIFAERKIHTQSSNSAPFH